MDGITGSPTLGGVVLATSAAAGSAVYKVKINVFRSLLFQDFLRVVQACLLLISLNIIRIFLKFFLKYDHNCFKTMF